MRRLRWAWALLVSLAAGTSLVVVLNEPWVDQECPHEVVTP